MKKLLLAGLFSLLAFPSLTMAQVTQVADVDTEDQSSCITISNNLRYRMRDASVNNEVSDLQDFLNMKGYLSSGPTGYFGMGTFNAVKKFQKASGFAPTGYVGPLTRAKIGELSCGGSTTSTATATPTTINTSTTQTTTTTATTAATTATTAATTAPIPTLTNLPVGCTSTSGFSSLTGSRCLVPATPAPTPTILPAGCASTAGFSFTTGQACGVTTTTPTVSLTAYPTTIALGQSSTLKLSSSNAGGGCSGVLVTDGKTFGTTTVSPTQTTSYGVTCYEFPYNGGRSASTKVTVSVVSATTTTTPAITSFSPAIAIAGINTKIRVHGKNLNTVSSASLISNTKGDNAYLVEWSPVSGTELEILTPADMRLGDYAVNLCSSSGCATSSSLLWIQSATTATSVPTVEVIGTPTLGLQYSTVNGNEELVGKATVKVTAGNQDIVLYEGSPLLLAFYSDIKRAYSNSMIRKSVLSSGSVSCGVNIYGCVLKANSSVTYDTITTALTKELFAGSYFIKSESFGYSDLQGHSVNIDLIGKYKSNSVTIIGETSPYITSVSTVTDPSGALIGYNIWGVRFNSTTNQVAINGVTKILPTNASDKGPLISFKPSDFGITTSGVYSLQVSTSDGASNFVNVNVTVQNSPTVTILSPNGGETMTVGKTYLLKWNIKNYPTEKGGLAEVILRNANTYTETSIVVGAGIDNNNESLVNWTIPASVAPGSYDIRIYVVSNAKDLIIKDASDAPFSIVTATIAQPTLAVVRSANSPSGPLITGTQKLAEFTLMASTSEDINVTIITTGNQSIDYGISNIKLYDASTQTQIGSTLSSLTDWHTQFYGFPLLVIPSGSYKTLSIYADIPSGAKGVNMGITEISAVGRSSGQTAIISGLPVYGNALLAVSTQSSQFAGVIGAFSQAPAPTPVTVAPTWTYAWTRNLEVNSPYKDDVTALQTALAKEGVFSGEMTGGFYTQTYLAVKAFQAKYGIDSTGFVGPQTRTKLNELY